MTVSMPTPEVTTPYSYYDTNRSRQITYWLEAKPAIPGEKAITVQVSVSHSKRSKAYSATVNAVEVEKTPYGVAESSWVLDGVRLFTEPTARFSQKGLEAATARALAMMPAVGESSEKVGAMFDPAYRPEHLR